MVNYNNNIAKVSVTQDGEKPPVTPVKMSPVTLPTSTNQQEPILTSKDNSSWSRVTGPVVLVEPGVPYFEKLGSGLT